MKRFDWTIDPGKFLSRKQTRKLIKTATVLSSSAKKKGHKVAVRDAFIIDLALSTGLRVMEIAALTCEDLFIHDERTCLFVRKGKGGKSRLVYFGKAFALRCQEYLDWKRQVGEQTTLSSPLFFSSAKKTYLTTRALEKAFKRVAKKAGLASHYSIHCLRHTYACLLYVESGYNLRLVQKQLGHASIKTTQVYADVMDGDRDRALQRFGCWEWNRAEKRKTKLRTSLGKRGVVALL